MHFIPTIAQWAPSVYYSLGAVDGTLRPCLTKPADGNEFPTLKDSDPQYFANDKRLRSDVKVCRFTCSGVMCAMGTNFSPKAYIGLDTNIEDFDSDYVEFNAWHEISHIRSNDNFVIPASAALASTIAAFVVRYMRSWLPRWAAPVVAICVPFIVGTNVSALVRLRAERRADAWACRWAQDKEVLAMRRATHAHLFVNQQLHSQYPHLFYKNGNLNPFRFGVMHIPLSERCGTLNAEVIRRNIPEVPEAEEREKWVQALLPWKNQYVKHMKLNVDGVVPR